MNDVAGVQTTAGGGHRPSGWQRAGGSHDSPAFLQNRGTTGAVDGPIHASSSEQSRVGGVHDGISF